MTVHTNNFKLYLGKGVDLDVMVLLDTKLLLVANSGGGKSYLIRVICEQVVDRIPTIILDREGEFATLREKHDVVLIGEGGEADTSVSTCAKLVRALVELGVSAVINLYDLSKQDQRKFVRIFCESLLKLPRSLWRPMFVVIDEIHEWCPESGGRESESREAVIEACSKLRKRGACVIGATQRFAKFSKDAAAEFNNVCVGRIAQDVDLRRAIDILGLQHREGAKTLREFEPGEWFGFGPAFEQRGIIRFHCAKAETTHPKAGERHRLQSPAPSKAILKVAPELAALKQEVEKEENELESLRVEVAELRSRPNAIPQSVIDSAHNEGVGDGFRSGWAALQEHVRADVVQESEKLTAEINKVVALVDALQKSTDELTATAEIIAGIGALEPDEEPPLRPPTNGKSRTVRVEQPFRPPETPTPRTRSSPSSGGLGKGAPMRLMQAVLQSTTPIPYARAALWARISISASTFGLAMADLKRQGLIETDGKMVCATREARRRFPNVKLLPTGAELIAHWREKLGGGADGRLFDALVRARGRPITQQQAADIAEISIKASTFGLAVAKLKKLGVLVRHPDKKISASPDMFT